MKKGFTLVEVLIVVVIIAILASLIVPRMLAQTEKAKAAEAIQMVGAIKRAAERHYDFQGSYNVTGNFLYTDPGGNTVGDWGELGLQIKKSTTWTFQYTPNNNGISFDARAYRASGVDMVQYNGYPGSEAWSCWVTFAPIEPYQPHYSQKGCTAA